MSEELKPCPFCGTCVERGAHEVWCDDCKRSLDIADDDWNSRPIEDALRAENEKLRTALSKISTIDYTRAATNLAATNAVQIAKAALSKVKP